MRRVGIGLLGVTDSFFGGNGNLVREITHLVSLFSSSSYIPMTPIFPISRLGTTPRKLATRETDTGKLPLFWVFIALIHPARIDPHLTQYIVIACDISASSICFSSLSFTNSQFLQFHLASKTLSR